MAKVTFEPPACLLSVDMSAPAGRRRVLNWLKGRLAARGVEALGPQSGDCRLVVPAEAGFVSIWVECGDGARLGLLVREHGEAEAEYEEALAACEGALEDYARA